MRVELAAASLALPSIVGAKLQQLSGTQGSGRGLVAHHLLFAPVWKQQNSVVQRFLTSLQQDDESSEPDVGILAPRSLEEFQSLFNAFNDTGSDFNLCDLMVADTAGMTCDCDNWMIFMGSISCTNDQQCFDDKQEVCGAASFSIDAQMTGNFTVDYCIDLEKPETHSYCMHYEVVAENVFGSVLGGTESAGVCSLSIDGKDCSECNIETQCTVTDNELPVAGLGDFDCSSTVAGTKGNQCDGKSPFPNIDTTKLAIFGNLNGDSVFGSGTTMLDDDTTAVTEQDADDAAPTEEIESGSDSNGFVITKCILMVALMECLVKIML